jgi:outer membrane protein OmpA-like peptidoglycan-associated protein
VLALGLPALAQSSVEVDQGVLDSLGPPAAAKKPGAKEPGAKKKAKPPRAAAPKPAALPKPTPVPPAPQVPPPEVRATPAAPPRGTASAPPPATPPAADFAVAPPPPPAAAPPQLVPGAATAPAPAGAASAAPTQARLTPVPAPAAPAPPPIRTVGETAARIPFAGEAAELGAEARGTLDGLLPRLEADERLRVEVLGYATAGSDASQARRVSLARALAVRTYLVDKGIKTSRVDVRALGSRPEGEPADRVDLVLATR